MPSLEELADHPAIIFPAYIAALLPLTVLYALDFITEKWKTVGHTRRTGHIYLFSSVPPLCFVVFYIHLQRVVKDYKEMAAAMSAAIFCIFHILRTLWGLVQLDAFKEWNKRALRCLNNMGYGAPVYEFVLTKPDGDKEDGIESGRQPETCTPVTKTCFARVRNVAFSAFNYLVSIFKDGDRYKESKVKKMNLSEAELGRTVDKHMVVNSSLVDNEFTGAELPCRLKKVCLLKATWALVTRGTTFRLSDYVECGMPVECSVRWIVVFVARFGSQWLTEKSALGRLEKYNNLSVDEQKKVFRRRVGAIAVLKTTFEAEGDRVSGVCPESPLLKTPSSQEGLRLTECERAHLPYMCSGYEGGDDISFEEMSSSVREVILGWDRRALSILDGDERKSVEEMSSYEIACFAKMMSSTMPGLSLAMPDWEHDDAYGMTQQIGDFNADGKKQFNSMVPTKMPLYHQNLWAGRFENKHVEQACVHIDNWAALESGRRLKRIPSPEDISDALREGKDTFHGHMTVETRAYEYDLSRDETVETRAAWGIIFVGSVMEAVRAFLAHSVAGLSDEGIGKINWRPRMDTKIFSIQCSKQLLNCLREQQNGADGAGTGGEEGPRAWNVETRLLWEMQQSFHNAVSTRAEEKGRSRGLMELNELMILCMLGFPCLEVRKERHTANNKSGTPTEGPETVHRYGSDTVLTMREAGCDTERAFFSVKPMQGPQPIWLNVSVDCATGTGEVEVLVGQKETACNVFDWQAWKDSFMGRVHGQAVWRERILGTEQLRPREEALQSILSIPIKTLKANVKQWGGWPPLYPRMSMISRKGTFGANRYDHNRVTTAMDGAASEIVSRPKTEMDVVSTRNISRAKKNNISTSVRTAMQETLRAQAQTAKREGRPSQSLELLCECVGAHKDPVALDEMLVLLRGNGSDLVEQHRLVLRRCMENVLWSSIESRQKRYAGRKGEQSATIPHEKLALCCSALREMCPEDVDFAEFQLRFLFEIRHPKLLPVLEDCRAKMIFPQDASLLAAVFCFDQWKSSGESRIRLLGEAYLETCALRCRNSKAALRIGYLFEKGILRGRQTANLRYLRWLPFGPPLSVQETACHFVAHSPDSLHVVRKNTATAVRIYERYNEPVERSNVLNRLGLLYLFNKDGLQDLERAEDLLNRAKRKYSKSAMCNLAVLYGFHRGKWDLAQQNLMNAIPYTTLRDFSDTPLNSHGFLRPLPDSVSINGNVYKIWDESEICKNPHTSSMNNLAVLYEVEDNSFGDVRQALELYERILAIDENPVALLNMTVLLKLGPAAVRDETRSERLLRTLQSRLPDNEHMPVLAKNIRHLIALSSSGAHQKWNLAVEELENCAVFVKQLDDQSGNDEST